MLTIKLVLFTLVAYSLEHYEGDECVLDGTKRKGVCKVVDQCSYAVDLLKNRRLPQHCGFHHAMPIVCCPYPNGITQNQRERISQKKCRSYQEKEEPTGTFGIAAYGGVLSLAREFPHMAILGYGDSNNPQWLCGGSLISDRFILTAAHCLYSQKFGDVKIARLGDLDIKNTTDDAAPEDFLINQTFRHPNYRPPSKYHDIALLQLDRIVIFGTYIKPACLYVSDVIPKEQITATGWGLTDYQGEPSSHLIKVYVGFISYPECKQAYVNTPARQLEQGILENLQICAGNVSGADTCPGDSGGPLQISYHDEKKEFKPYYQIIGVTSFGKACGFQNSTGVYTRISGYLSWIESIVWRDDYVLW